MTLTLDLVTLMTDHLADMKQFYTSILDLDIDNEHDQYLEFRTGKIRFAICERDLMLKETGDTSYNTDQGGQRVELAFEAEDTSSVDTWFETLQHNGVTIIKKPHTTPWGLYTMMFADPDGNIHEIYCR